MNTKTLNFALSACAAASVLLLSACGGGSADDGVKTVARSNTQAESSSNAATTTCGTPSGTSLATFDESTPKTVSAFGDGEGYAAIDVAPAGANQKALTIVRKGGQNYAGAKVAVGAISTSATNNTITACFYSATAGIPVVLKLEGETDKATGLVPITTGDIKSNETVKAGWQKLSWTVPDSKLGLAYTNVAILPNLGTVASASVGETYYLDDVTLTTGSSITPTPSISLPVSFDEIPAPTFVGFDGAEGSTIETAPSGGDKKALKIVRKGGMVYAGAKVNVGTIALTTTNNTISARVYSPTAGKPFVIKLENAADSNINTGDVPANEAVVVGWQTLTWTIPNAKFASNYNAITLLPNLGTLASAITGETYYVDDLKQIAGTTPTPTPSSSALATFDEAIALDFVGFDGAEGSVIETGPTGGDKKALKILRKGGMVYAGAKVKVGTIALTSTSNKISVRVYSPTAGKLFVIKLENYADGSIATNDLPANEAVVSGWQTLTFTVPSAKIASIYNAVTLLPNLGTIADATTGETYYVDDIKLLGSVTPAPGGPEVVVVSGYNPIVNYTGYSEGTTTDGGKWGYYSGNFSDNKNTYTGSDSKSVYISVVKQNANPSLAPSSTDQAYVGIYNLLKTGGVTLSGQTTLSIEMAVDQNYLDFLNSKPNATLRINIDGAQVFKQATGTAECRYGVRGYLRPTSTSLTKYTVSLEFAQGCGAPFIGGGKSTLAQVLAEPIGSINVTADSPYDFANQLLDNKASINAFVKNASNEYVTGFAVGGVSFK